MATANADKPSKSARKRERLALQALGEALIGLPVPSLGEVPLDERLREAVLEARGMQSRGALRRQRQLIGKLMRSADAEAIRGALARLGQNDRRATRLFHDAENWRDRICAEGTAAIAEFAADTDGDTRALARLAEELAAATGEDRRRSLRRRIFREVHSGLCRLRQSATRSADAVAE